MFEFGPHLHRIMFHAHARHMNRPFGGPPFGPEGGNPRQRRGDIRLWLLDLLKDKPRHGYELIKILEERAGGFYRPSPGTIYPTLQLLEEEGNLTSELIDGKRVYTITAQGRETLEGQQSAAEEHGRHHGRPGGPSPHMQELRRNAAALMESTMTAGRYGTPEQVQAVQELLRKTNQEIHVILSKNDETRSF